MGLIPLNALIPSWINICHLIDTGLRRAAKVFGTYCQQHFWRRSLSRPVKESCSNSWVFLGLISTKDSTSTITTLGRRIRIVSYRWISLCTLWSIRTNQPSAWNWLFKSIPWGNFGGAWLWNCCFGQFRYHLEIGPDDWCLERFENFLLALQTPLTSTIFLFMHTHSTFNVRVLSVKVVWTNLYLLSSTVSEVDFKNQVRQVGCIAVICKDIWK